jgi:hypothetical protein
MESPIFISHSSKDQTIATSVCNALEKRRLTCWIANRDVGPGKNYQEEIVKAIRSAKVMVLVFTGNANNSDEIKKELSLASRYKLIVIPARAEDLVSTEAFELGLATRQGIDLFDNWERKIDELTTWIESIITNWPKGQPSESATGARAREGRSDGFLHLVLTPWGTIDNPVQAKRLMAAGAAVFGIVSLLCVLVLVSADRVYVPIASQLMSIAFSLNLIDLPIYECAGARSDPTDCKLLSAPKGVGMVWIPMAAAFVFALCALGTRYKSSRIAASVGFAISVVFLVNFLLKVITYQKFIITYILEFPLLLALCLIALASVRATRAHGRPSSEYSRIT